MATERTITELLALFADNSAGDISEQDCRDLIVSLSGSYGGMHISGAVQTVFSGTSTDGSNAVKMLGTTILSAASRDMDMPVSNRLRHTGAPTRFHELNIALSVISAANSKTYGFYIAKNGIVDTASLIRRKQGTGSDVGALSMVFHVELAQTDYIEIFIENQTDTTSMTVTQSEWLLSHQVTQSLL